ncbi:hypothetical protein PVL29_018304 [Vitis rotundifolia]|uniref:Endonuclease/exonuclease/phosphatase domain-containing protein n=1 Tax=Vitis rotundifolia TaxID=103349 RepID=A0AA39DEV0_VITRO|nr:hypothetical protein PVL29_018304 [Vitis rotundifolia]
MKIRILSWNIRGANNCDKIKVIKALIKKNRVDLGCLQETKIQEMSRGLIRSLGVGRFLKWGAVDSRGSTGGIVVFWDNRDGFSWTFTGVYGSTIRRDRECLWNELEAIYGLWNGLWCVAGDFNAILSPEEHSRGGSLNSDMRRFSDVIEEL